MNTLFLAIAKHLNIVPAQIAEVREWAKVFWVRVNGCRPTFVSKKIQESVMDPWEIAEASEKEACQKKDELAGHFAKFECIRIGSKKQLQWAGYIFAKACEHLAISVLENEISQSEAEKILQEPSASWWIDNRGQFDY